MTAEDPDGKAAEDLTVMAAGTGAAGRDSPAWRGP